MKVTIDLVMDGLEIGNRHKNKSTNGEILANNRRASNTHIQLLNEFMNPDLEGDDTPQSGDATPTEDEPVDLNATNGDTPVIVIRSVPISKSNNWETPVSVTQPDDSTPPPRGNDSSGWESPPRNGHAKGSDTNKLQN